MKKIKILIFLLIISSFVGFLEWGGGNKLFLIMAEIEILNKIFTNPKSILHPFIILPFFSQLILFITLFQKKINHTLIYFGIIGLGLLLGFMFFIGIISLNFKILFSTIPFMIVAFLTIRQLRKLR